MSRIGSQPIPLPEGVSVDVGVDSVTVTGPRGALTVPVHRYMKVAINDGVLTCAIDKKTKQSAALWGTTRAIIANAVKGVTEGFSKQLELQGVGYKAQLKGKDLELALGYSHPISVPAPEGIEFAVEKEFITVSGNDPIQVGQVAADIRKLRKPEPYKGKGVRYVGEHVRRKVGKVVGTAE